MKINTKICFYFYVIVFLYLMNPYVIGVIAGTFVLGLFGNHLFVLVLLVIALYWYMWSKVRGKCRLYEDMYYWSFIRPFEVIKKDNRSKLGRRKEDHLSELVLDKFEEPDFIRYFTDEELDRIKKLDVDEVSEIARLEIEARKKNVE